MSAMRWSSMATWFHQPALGCSTRSQPWGTASGSTRALSSIEEGIVAWKIAGHFYGVGAHFDSDQISFSLVDLCVAQSQEVP